MAVCTLLLCCVVGVRFRPAAADTEADADGAADEDEDADADADSALAALSVSSALVLASSSCRHVLWTVCLLFLLSFCHS